MRPRDAAVATVQSAAAKLRRAGHALRELPESAAREAAIAAVVAAQARVSELLAAETMPKPGGGANA